MRDVNVIGARSAIGSCRRGVNIHFKSMWIVNLLAEIDHCGLCA